MKIISTFFISYIKNTKKLLIRQLFKKSHFSDSFVTDTRTNRHISKNWSIIRGENQEQHSERITSLLPKVLITLCNCTDELKYFFLFQERNILPKYPKILSELAQNFCRIPSIFLQSYLIKIFTFCPCGWNFSSFQYC